MSQLLQKPVKYLGVEELASLLGVSTATIYRMRSLGEDLPPAFKIGSQVRWRQEVVEEWIQAQEKTNA